MLPDLYIKNVATKRREILTLVLRRASTC